MLNKLFTESNKIYETKLEFIENNKNKYNKKELLILAKIFINIKFKGCQYNNKIHQKLNI